MKMLARTGFALSGGTAALVRTFAAALGVVVVLLAAVIPPSQARVAPAPPAPAAAARPLDTAAPGGTGVHIASLTACVSGLDC